MLKKLTIIIAVFAICFITGLPTFAEQIVDSRTPSKTEPDFEYLYSPAVKPKISIIISATVKDVDLAAELAQKQGRLVHILIAKADDLMTFRRKVSSLDMDGLITVEYLNLSPLPYVSQIADEIIIPDEETVSKEHLTQKEIMRVLAPGGILKIGSGNSQVQTIKSYPKDMDIWTHPLHGPDGNRVSLDKHITLPLDFRWQAGLPINIRHENRPANRLSSTRGCLVSDGRVYIISDSTSANLGPVQSMGSNSDQYLTARSAFNGLLLWRKKLGNMGFGDSIHENHAPFVTVGGKVYLSSDQGELLILNGANGQTERIIKTAFTPGGILVDDNILIVSGMKNGIVFGDNYSYRREPMTGSISDGSLQAFNPSSGKLLWQIDRLADSIVSSQGILFTVFRKGAYPEILTRSQWKKMVMKKGVMPERSVVAIDLKSGNIIWEVSANDLEMPDKMLRIVSAGLGVVCVSVNCDVRMLLSAKNGKKLTSGKSVAVYEDGKIHFNGKFINPEDGSDVSGVEKALHLKPTVCVPFVRVNGIKRFGGKKFSGTNGLRSSCILGLIPGYGTLYVPQNACTCYKAQIPGMVALGATENSEESNIQGYVPDIIKGSAKLPKIKNTEKGWSFYRANAERSSSITSAAPENFQVLWTTFLLNNNNKSPVIETWKEYLNDSLTAPVVEDKVLITTAPNRNIVYGLNRKNGLKIWEFATGGRVSTSPTLYNGICLFGANDGRVYAVNAQTGRMIWNFRASPSEGRMVSYGKIESKWPVVGSILIINGTAFASAGRSDAAWGGLFLYAFEPENGKLIWSRRNLPSSSKQLTPGLNDIMLRVGSAVQLMSNHFSPENGNPIDSPIRTSKLRRTTHTLPQLQAYWLGWLVLATIGFGLSS